MNQEQVSGKFDQLAGKIKEKWGNLTNDDVALYNGRQEQFYGRLKEKYGLARDEAERQVRDIQDTLSDSANRAA